MEENIITCKLVVVGDSWVGKTCIVQHFVNNNYNENTETTTSGTYTYKKVDYKQFNTSISFDILDIPGSELFRSFAKNFYINSSIGILVYDVRRKESFESIKNYWYGQLKELREDNIVFGFAGNKCDLFHENEVSEEEVKEFAKSIGAVFYLTSSKESIGIDELFKECGEEFLIKHYKNKVNQFPFLFKYLSF